MVRSGSVDVMCGSDGEDAKSRRSTGNARPSASTAYTFVALSRMPLHNPPLQAKD